jgi:putative transposase
MSTVKVAKTTRQKIENRPGFAAWYSETKTLYNQVVSFYFDVYQARPDLIDAEDWLRRAEAHTHRTVKNPDPAIPLDQAIVADIPAMFRRAAISQASGAFQSFASNLARHKKDKLIFESKTGKNGKPRIYNKRPPVPPRIFNFNPSLYDGMRKGRTSSEILVKLYAGSAWQWTKLNLSGDQPDGWEDGSPIIVQRRGHFFLHTPVFKRIEKPLKLAQQVENETLTRICSADLNLDGPAAVCVILNNDGTPVATQFVKRSAGLDDRRKRLLGKVATKRSQTGIIAEDQQDNARTWQKIQDLDDNEAHRISRRIVDFAATHSASALVFEHLENLKPTKGQYSKRSNTKRSYWLKGKIVQFAKYKAWHSGIVVSRVSPKDTSRLCPCCKLPVTRYSSGQAPVDYAPGNPLFLCPSCLDRGNADRAAAINVGHKFLNRYYPGQFWPTSEKPRIIESPLTMDVNFYV